MFDRDCSPTCNRGPGRTTAANRLVRLGLLAAGLCLGQAALASPPQRPPAAGTAAPGVAGLAGTHASADTRLVAAWVIRSGDNAGLPFVIVDKAEAKVLAFDPAGRLAGATPALLGLARGDEIEPGIGDRPLADISPAQRVTPAGRFVAALGEDLHSDVLWVDYDAALSLHRVVTNKPAERRLQRLATPTPKDNRISYGCINVPAAFYDTVIRPMFKGTTGIVYILPETRSASEMFFTPRPGQRASAKP